MDRRFAECGVLCRCGPIELHDAGAPLEHLGPLADRDQATHSFAHRPPLPFSLKSPQAARRATVSVKPRRIITPLHPKLARPARTRGCGHFQYRGAPAIPTRSFIEEAFRD